MKPPAVSGLFSNKTLALLRMCEMKSRTQDRKDAWHQACETYSEKSCRAKLIELSKRGYIIYTPESDERSAWLTEKGQRALQVAV